MKVKVLIVDDENDFCEIMRGYFTRKGYEVYLAYSLTEGLNCISEVRPEILFLDNNLPDGHGWDRVDEIVEIIPQSRVFLISAHKTSQNIKINKPSKIAIWEKPISMKTLDLVF